MSMAKFACVFPGQGSQYVGMGRDLYEADPGARRCFDEADRVLGFGLSEICFEGPEERLRETRYTQPAILVHSVALWSFFERVGRQPDFVAGHSVGEYSALVAAGALAFGDALTLVRERAEAMYSAGLDRPGAMAAMIGLPPANLQRLLEEAGKAGVIAAANYNSPIQIVISGEVEPIEIAVEKAKDLGAKRAIRLNVSGAFHSPLMEPAQKKLAAKLQATRFSDARIPVVANVTGTPVSKPEETADLLGRQLTSPVLWYQSMQFLVEQGVESFVEVGPGTVLCGLLKRIVPDAECISCSDEKSVTEFLEGVSA
jgi:[acyl-carrier-protein] S-malonyltransferase